MKNNERISSSIIIHHLQKYVKIVHMNFIMKKFVVCIIMLNNEIDAFFALRDGWCRLCEGIEECGMHLSMKTFDFRWSFINFRRILTKTWQIVVRFEGFSTNFFKNWLRIFIFWWNLEVREGRFKENFRKSFQGHDKTLILLLPRYFE